MLKFADYFLMGRIDVGWLQSLLVDSQVFGKDLSEGRLIDVGNASLYAHSYLLYQLSHMNLYP